MTWRLRGGTSSRMLTALVCAAAVARQACASDDRGGSLRGVEPNRRLYPNFATGESDGSLQMGAVEEQVAKGTIEVEGNFKKVQADRLAGHLTEIAKELSGLPVVMTADTVPEDDRLVYEFVILPPSATYANTLVVQVHTQWTASRLLLDLREKIDEDPFLRLVTLAFARLDGIEIESILVYTPVPTFTTWTTTRITTTATSGLNTDTTTTTTATETDTLTTATSATATSNTTITGTSLTVETTSSQTTTTQAPAMQPGGATADARPTTTTTWRKLNINYVAATTTTALVAGPAARADTAPLPGVAIALIVLLVAAGLFTAAYAYWRLRPPPEPVRVKPTAPGVRVIKASISSTSSLELDKRGRSSVPSAMSETPKKRARQPSIGSKMEKEHNGSETASTEPPSNSEDGSCAPVSSSRTAATWFEPGEPPKDALALTAANNNAPTRPSSGSTGSSMPVSHRLAPTLGELARGRCDVPEQPQVTGWTSTQAGRPAPAGDRRILPAPASGPRASLRPVAPGEYPQAIHAPVTGREALPHVMQRQQEAWRFQMEGRRR